MRSLLAAVLIALLITLIPIGKGTHSTDDHLLTLHTRLNNGRIGIMSGNVQGTYIRLAADLANLLDGNDLRIVPMVGKGSFQAVEDLLGLQGVDVAMLQSDVLNLYYRYNDPTPGLANKLQYITALYDEELHILAGPGITSVWDLDGQVVNIGPQSTGTFMTSMLVFADLGINVDTVALPHELALEKLRRGEIAALARIAGQPAGFFSAIPANSELQLLEIPTDRIAAPYKPAKIDQTSYPNLTTKSINTIAISALLVTSATQQDREQEERLDRFVTAFFDKFDRLRADGYHPKWRDIDLAAIVPGWRRLPAAKLALNNRKTRQHVPAHIGD